MVDLVEVSFRFCFWLLYYVDGGKSPVCFSTVQIVTVNRKGTLMIYNLGVVNGERIFVVFTKQEVG